MKNMKPIKFLTTILTATLVIITQGCDPQVSLSGVVVDTKGEALPGVGVAARGTESQAVSNGVGRYSMNVPPGKYVLEMVKTGYTPAEVEIDTGSSGTLEADTALMWPLPNRKGVFLYQNHRYLECTQAEPKRFMRIETKEGKETVLDSPPLFATKRTPDLKTLANFSEVGVLGETPLLIAYKLPAYDVELHRLELTTAAIFVPRANRGAKASDNDLPRDTVWAPVESIPLSAVPVDQPGRMLLDLRPAYPLSPGIYAIHWGAFAGYNTIDGRIFLFEVIDPNASFEAEIESPEPLDDAADTEN
jgi:hypothetical protein